MYKVTTVEDQDKFILPLNRITEQIYYGQRLIIDAKVLTEPRAWHITKVNRVSTNGLILFTIAQDLFNPHTDFVEKDENDVVIGMWADYYKDGVKPKEEDIPVQSNVYSEITYSGNKRPELKVGGSYKTFTVKFYNDEGEIDSRHGNWEYKINGNDASNLLDIVNVDDFSVKIKIKQDADDYIENNLVISFTSIDGIKSSVTMNIIGL